MDSPTCASCVFGRQTAVRDGRAYQCRIDAPKVSPLPNGLQTTSAWPVVDANDLCGRHPLHPVQRARIVVEMAKGIIGLQVDAKDPWAETVIGRAYQLADAIIAARAKETK